MRCSFVTNNELYINYHDNEWGKPSYDDNYLFEMFILESFHCGLSWFIILSKREAFKKAYDNFNVNKVANYSNDKINELLNNNLIVRHEGKIRSSISNAKCFVNIQKEFGSFSNYIWSFTNNEVVYRTKVVNKNELSDIVSKDLKKEDLSLWEVSQLILS